MAALMVNSLLTGYLWIIGANYCYSPKLIFIAGSMGLGGLMFDNSVRTNHINMEKSIQDVEGKRSGSAEEELIISTMMDRSCLKFSELLVIPKCQICVAIVLPLQPKRERFNMGVPEFHDDRPDQYSMTFIKKMTTSKQQANNSSRPFMKCWCRERNKM
ncbi:hypothetical protein KIN20_027186 [Parelaphostrongylus tenuis]|uniref:Uncharacterized protein n=1 Tax=Parelaphostrongylus tenuis TaxID=148309 RepID=A0AAD5QZ88_PARTN|nr:hypothetical protein KIN20_027186 [Parelaphostrongylus tenuis]